MAFSTSSSSILNSAAFLQLQKNANLNRRTSMSDDVFRIFRQTGRRIALIKQQVERERSSYLKESYMEKNQLYKELAAIAHSKKALHEKSKELAEVGRDLNTTSSAFPVLSSSLRTSPLKEDKDNNNDRHLKEHKGIKELPSINVNVLKRCECCRRRAFRTVSDDDDDDAEDICEGSNVNDREKGIQSAKTTAKKKYNKQRARVVQLSRYDDVRIPVTQRVQAGIWALKKQTKDHRKKTFNHKSVSFQTKDSSRGLDDKEEKDGSINENKKSSCTLASGSATSARPARSRTSVKNEYQTTKSNERIHLEGNSWMSHVENVQEKKLSSSSKKVSGLSKAYCAFKKVLKQMDDERDSDEEKSRFDLLVSRPTSNVSRSDCSRWDPLRRSSATLPAVRLNTWTAGTSPKTAHLNNFDENRVEDEDTKPKESQTVS